MQLTGFRLHSASCALPFGHIPGQKEVGVSSGGLGMSESLIALESELDMLVAGVGWGARARPGYCWSVGMPWLLPSGGPVPAAGFEDPSL